MQGHGGDFARRVNCLYVPLLEVVFVYKVIELLYNVYVLGYICMIQFILPLNCAYEYLYLIAFMLKKSKLTILYMCSNI